jgi:hypothetical protein
MMTIPPCVFSRPAVAARLATVAPTLGAWPIRTLAPITTGRALPFIYTKPAVDNEMVVRPANAAVRIAPEIAPLSLRNQG